MAQMAPVLCRRMELSWLAAVGVPPCHVGVPPCHGTARAGFGVRLPLPAWSWAVAAGGTVSRWAASMRSEHVSGFSVLEPPPLYPLWAIGVRGVGNPQVRSTREHVPRYGRHTRRSHPCCTGAHKLTEAAEDPRRTGLSTVDPREARTDSGACIAAGGREMNDCSGRIPSQRIPRRWRLHIASGAGDHRGGLPFRRRP